MSARTLVNHHHAELTFAYADDITGIVAFTALSKSTPGKINTVSLDTATGERHCDCVGAETGKVCWHLDWVAAAWANHETRRLVRAMTTAQLIKAGRKAKHMCDIYRARIWRCVPADQALLVAARCEWRERAALAEAPESAAA